jgi:formamidopyrimidine-DNA glycosylase
MRELPEIETIRRAMDKEVVGRKVKSVEVHDAKMLVKPTTAKALQAAVDGAKISEVTRQGLLMVVNFDNEVRLVLDLDKKGFATRNANKDKVADGTKVSIMFTQGGQLRFGDAGKTARLILVEEGEELADLAPEVDMTGLDPIESPMSWAEFGQMMLARSTKLGTLLTDQTIITGLGPVYADEILFRAGLRHDRLSDSLGSQEVRRLYRSLVETVHDAVKHRGVTLEGGDYTDLFGEPGDWGQFLEVHGRDKDPCRRCRNEITKAKINSRTTYFCPQCQV